MATPEKIASQPEGRRPELRLVEEVADEVDEWTRIARQIEIELLDAEDEEGQTHTLSRQGEPIGATGVFTRRVIVGDGQAVHAAEIEVFATNEAYYHPAYLALINSLIKNDPDLSVINGAEGPEMAAVAADLTHHLPLGWSSEFSLIAGGIEVSTYDPSALAAHLANGGRVEHSFRKIGSI